MMSPETPRFAYDLFVSYAHADDRDENREKVAALFEAIKGFPSWLFSGPFKPGGTCGSRRPRRFAASARGRRQQGRGDALASWI